MNVVYAQNGEDGLAIAREQLPDAIVTDLMMPQMAGLELTSRIRNDELTSHIPVIVVTAKVTEKDRLEGLRAGADDYLTKPFSSDELLTRINNLLEQRALLRKKYQALPGLTPPTPDKSQAPADALNKRFLNRTTDAVYVSLNAGKNADVNAVAGRLHMSYSQFYRKLTALTGLTPVQYIQRIKVAKAKLMLTKHPEMSLNAVAEQCGFSDYSNFVRAFRNVMNMSPTQFVRQSTGT